MKQPIHLQLATLRVRQHRRQQDIANALGVRERTVTRWDNGHRTPSIHHADAYARVLHHHLVATNQGHVIDTVTTLLPKLPLLRRAHGLTQADLGWRSLTSRTAVTQLEARIRAGDQTLLTSAEWYVTGLGYAIELVPASALERAA